jgi:hypothetical protein
MLTQLAYTLLALQPWAPAPPAGAGADPAPAAAWAAGAADAPGPTADAGDIRIVAVEQAGGPPYAPRDGRVYRLGGDAISDVRLGEILIVRRPGELRDIGFLRVVSVHTENFAANSALAKLEFRGETFPLKGDLATKLAPASMPEIGKQGARAPKDGLPPPLDPAVLPGLPGGGGRADGHRTEHTTAPHAALPTRPRGAQAPRGPRPAPKNAPKAAPAAAGQDSAAAGGPAGGLMAADLVRPPSVPRAPAGRAAADAPRFLEQNPVYFERGSAEISPKGIEKLGEWAAAWGAYAAAPDASGGHGGLTYFLSVPQNQLRMQRLTADRLAALQAELRRLGVAAVELRYDERSSVGPFDVVYVGAESPSAPPAP